MAITKEELKDLDTVFTVAIRAFAEDKNSVKGILALQEKVLKELEDGKLQSTTDNGTGSKESDEHNG